ncbi:MAG: lipid-A-disaccharide synthase [Prevotella sp.]|nr:lipid-A-disaccharide synthase [Prevotella sp.]
MKYYLIVGEASGDLHASHLMQSLKRQDPQAEFRFLGGDLMAAAGGVCVRHYKDLAYMGFVPVLLHLPTIFRNMRKCKEDILAWRPDALILVDYPGFNLKIAEFIARYNKTAQHPIKVYYYIAPKIWAWKEWRIKEIKRNIDALFSILPFEVSFFEQKHGYPVHYVGNPTADEVRRFKSEYNQTKEEFCMAHGLDASKPIIALLAGSRLQEIKNNLPAMVSAARPFTVGEQPCQLVVAGAPAVGMDFYASVMKGEDVCVVPNQTYALLSHARAALVTSGTATLETAMFDVPQVVCYKVSPSRLSRWAFEHIVKVKYISLVNLIAEKEVVKELFAELFTVENIAAELGRILVDGKPRIQMLESYQCLQQHLGEAVAPDNAAQVMCRLLHEKAFEQK